MSNGGSSFGDTGTFVAVCVMLILTEPVEPAFLGGILELSRRENDPTTGRRV